MIDRNLMRMKDIVLIVGAILGLMAGVFKAYEKPYQVERDYKSVKEKVNGHTAKYEPIVESQAERITRIETTQKLVLETVQRIERKIDRVNQ